MFQFADSLIRMVRRPRTHARTHARTHTHTHTHTQHTECIHHSETERETDRQTNRDRERDRDRETDRQTSRQAGRQAGRRQADRQRQRDRRRQRVIKYECCRTQAGRLTSQHSPCRTAKVTEAFSRMSFPHFWHVHRLGQHRQLKTSLLWSESNTC